MILIYGQKLLWQNTMTRLCGLCILFSAMLATSWKNENSSLYIDTCDIQSCYLHLSCMQIANQTNVSLSTRHSIGLKTWKYIYAYIIFKLINKNVYTQPIVFLYHVEHFYVFRLSLTKSILLNYSINYI